MVKILHKFLLLQHRSSDKSLYIILSYTYIVKNISSISMYSINVSNLSVLTVLQ